MNKTELIESIAQKADIPKKDAEKGLNAFIETVTEVLEKGDKLSLVGFGTFEVRERAERTGLNPATKQPMLIKASKAPAFKPGKALKEALNK
ncbi:MAG: HU family DNA-binding protein [Eubacteriaceae bacterium]|jgi:DNA-binding protein HU-beta